jgi:hypothetical protein
LSVDFWPALQAYGRDLVHGYPKPDLVAPTRNEMEFTLASSLQAGARGIFIYTYLHSTVYQADLVAQKKWPFIDAKPLSEVAPSVWASALGCVATARALLPELDGAMACSDVRASGDPTIEMRQWKTLQGTLVIVANPTYQARTVSLAFAPSVPVERLSAAKWEAVPPPSPGRLDVRVEGPGAAFLRLPAPSGP